MTLAKTDMAKIAPGTMIPDLLRAHPEVRPVLDRYGLRGCGGPLGPMESLEFFARAHEVPLDDLLVQLHAALAQPTAVTASASSLADTIYQPFFKAGIALVLTLGAAWGAFLLLRIGFLGSFTSVGIHEVNAHGHAQIFGWVGLFVMGFAYQAFPRFKHTSLSHPRLAMATLWMMLVGIVFRSGGQALLGVSPSFAAVGVAGSCLEIAAILVFAGIVWTTLRRSGKPFAFYDYYILSAIVWFVVQAVCGTVYFVALCHAPDRDALLALVAQWQAPLRDAQIHGFALLMILGVSQRIFHNFYGLPAPRPRRSSLALVLINLAVLGEMAGFVLMRGAGHQWASLWYGSVLVLTGAVLYLVWGWHLYSPAKESDRSLKFLRTAYAWLFVSLAMLVLLPLYQFGALRLWVPASEAAELGFSHAYYGAIRHAITVGFVSMMIVGVAAKVVPTLKGIDVRGLSGLWLPFVLLNIGCAMRVGFQTLTDFHAGAFPVAGVSGLLEVTALAIWGVHLFGIMAGRVTGRAGHAQRPVLQAGSAIMATHYVGDVLDARPELLPIFLEFGFAPLANPVLRRTLAKHITLEDAARRIGVDLVAFLDALNRQRGVSVSESAAQIGAA